MKNIIRSQLVQLRKDRVCRLIFFGVLAATLLVVLALTDVALGDIKITGGELTVILLSMSQLLGQSFMYLFTAQACGADFMDKTCNYEILSGHTRREVFFGRAIPTLIIGTLGTMFLIAAPLVAEVLIHGGWGDKVSLTDMLLRSLLLVFPVARCICEFIFLTYLIKNPYIVMGASFILWMFLNINIPATREHCFILGISNIKAITNIDRWQSFGLGGNMHHIYITALEADFVLPTIIVSVIMGGIALLLGYTFFKHDDMH